MDKRYSPQQLPPLPEYLEPSTHNHSLQGNFTLSVPDNNASSKRITRSTSNFSGMWEYSAYVGNSIRGSDMFDYKNDQEVPDRFLNSQEDNYATVPQPKRMSFFGTPTEKSQEMISNLEPSHFVPIPQHPQQSIYDPNLNNFPSTPYNPISHHTPPSINNPIGNDNEQDRLTKAWYEKPLWDNRTSSYPYAPGQGQHENRIRDPISILLPPRYNNPIYQDYDFLRGPDVPPNGRKSRIRKSTKSVRWEDENCGTNVVNNSVARVL
ncbi:uncharacterized protein L201_000247 [Kwoniella dendrophila CBS 6074]|uniref:Uncharacterized protein n=1 Tax=Kwoniella dendrophila CBS 6074 TaxID=1295534 RepID=A0AAX4JKH8_9TREE